MGPLPQILWAMGVVPPTIPPKQIIAPTSNFMGYGPLQLYGGRPYHFILAYRMVGP
jgi:hypothetical protein